MASGFYEIAASRLPHPPIPLAVTLVIEDALRTAWKHLRSRPRRGFILQSANEDEVTHELYMTLWDEIFAKGKVKGFDRQLFSIGTREGKLTNYNGKSIDKMPDLLIALINRPLVAIPTQDWIIIEAKPVDPRHSAGIHYCDKGIKRFVRGDYAWALTSAMMLGYVRDGYTINRKLIPALKKRKRSLRISTPPRRCRYSIQTPFAEHVQITDHGRSFGRRTPITIRHLWLNRD